MLVVIIIIIIICVTTVPKSSLYGTGLTWELIRKNGAVKETVYMIPAIPQLLRVTESLSCFPNRKNNEGTYTLNEKGQKSGNYATFLANA